MPYAILLYHGETLPAIPLEHSRSLLSITSPPPDKKAPGFWLAGCPGTCFSSARDASYPELLTVCLDFTSSLFQRGNIQPPHCSVLPAPWLLTSAFVPYSACGSEKSRHCFKPLASSIDECLGPRSAAFFVYCNLLICLQQ